jgi:hypothetical protein
MMKEKLQLYFMSLLTSVLALLVLGIMLLLYGESLYFPLKICSIAAIIVIFILIIYVVYNIVKITSMKQQ